jgi:hypothetical protein
MRRMQLKRENEGCNEVPKEESGEKKKESDRNVPKKTQLSKLAIKNAS